MKPYLGKSALIRVGVQTVIESDALDSSRGVVFEDDGETGYFYARDYAVKDQLIADALHIYTARTVSDAEKPVRLRILWDAEWLRSALLLEDVPHAMFDFAEKCGYSKDPFPEPSPESGWRHAPWHNDLRKFFYD